MQVEIITPDSTVFSGQAEAIVVPGTDGLLGILNSHAPLISSLKAGEVKVTQDGKDQLFNITGGVVEVQNDKIMVLAD
ncbi:MAG: F-type H+-transporting ATPase subunit epsilon [Sphingobacteriales bacterium]|jgi:F-type H+-transporting ATPase subunit epsilon